MRNQHKTVSVRVIVPLLLLAVLLPLLPLLISWRWGWWEAWAYATLFILGFAVSRGLAARRHPNLMAERVRFAHHKNDKPWDRFLAPLVVLGLVLIPLTAGLDTRFGWSCPFSLPAKVLSLILIPAGYAWGTYALLENRFFSAIVRIQIERGHQAVSTGPYRYMRHPGYAGTLLASLATPILLDSRWSFLPAAFLTVVLIIRTALEDRTLQRELPGYSDYAKRVRYRLLPGVW